MLLYKFLKISEIDENTVEDTFYALSNEQKEYILSLNAIKRKQSLAARALLWSILKDNLNLSVEQLTFDKSGKPYLFNSKFYISLTHSKEYVGCALSDTRVGIDIEQIRQVKEVVIDRVCSAAEKEYLSTKDADEFFTLWTLKEAYIKASSSNLSKLAELSFVEEGKITNKFKFGQIDNYKWAIVTL